ncbi:MAG: DUF4282 domain-containing protein [Caulobacteraceae bacterium]
MIGVSKPKLGRQAFLLNMLTFEHLVTGPVVHWIYWAGLGVIALSGFSVIGASIGIAIRESTLIGALLSLPVLVAGLLVVFVLALLWRSFCEFYVVIFRIADDLRALRQAAEAEVAPPRQAPPQAAPAAQPTYFPPSA